MPFTFEPLDIEGVVLITPRVFSDDRGFFLETYKQSDFEAAGIGERFVQENQSYSIRGVLRGLHFQRQPQAQGKLIQAQAGEIFDVIVDLRPGTETFGSWTSVRLKAEEKRLLYVPPWCAHGFYVLSREAIVTYKVTREYAPQLEAGIIWNDPALAIRWPDAHPVLSPRDREWPTLEHAGLEPAAGREQR